MRLLVCGDLTDPDAVWKALDRAHNRRRITRIIAGDRPGAERLAMRWASDRAIERAPYPVDYTTGPAAALIRNQRMLDTERPQGVVAFGTDEETADVVRRARQAGLPVWEPYPPK